MQGQYAVQYAGLYRRHWWWRSRESILMQVIRNHLDASSPAILDVGCGDGLSFPQLDRFGTVRGIETDESLLTDGPFKNRIFTAPLGDPSYRGWRFDLITALDVIEHIDDDERAVDDMLAMLCPGGKLVVTVPAFMLLWDRHDEINGHYRRYTASKIRNLLRSRGRILELRYLFHSIFLPKLVLKFVNHARNTKIAQHEMPSDIINSAMVYLCVAEHKLLRHFKIPFGTSILVVLEKTAAPFPSTELSKG